MTLFALAINDNIKVISSAVSCSLYADDFTLYYSGGSLEDVQGHMQTAVNQIVQWATYHGFKFSLSKTMAMYFCMRGKFYPSLYLGVNPLYFVQEVVYLGLFFDSSFTWVPHIKSLKVKASTAFSILRVRSHLSWGADRTTILRLYRALIRSKLNNGCEANSSATPIVLRILDSIYNEVLRICTGAFRSLPVESLHDYMNLINYTRLQKIPESPTSRLVSNPFEDILFFGRRMRNFVEDLNLNLTKVLAVGTPQFPPWSNQVELVFFGIGKGE